MTHEIVEHWRSVESAISIILVASILFGLLTAIIVLMLFIVAKIKEIFQIIYAYPYHGHNGTTPWSDERWEFVVRAQDSFRSSEC